MLSAFTPPEGMNDIRVNGAARARIAAGPPSRPAGKNLTSSSPRAAGGHQVARRGHPGQRGHAQRPAALHDLDRQAGADDEPGPGLHDLVDLLRDQDRAGADVHAGHVGQPADRLEPGVGAQGDLDDVDAAGQQGLAQRAAPAPGGRARRPARRGSGRAACSSWRSPRVADDGASSHDVLRVRSLRQLVAGGQALPVAAAPRRRRRPARCPSAGSSAT